MSLDCLTYGEQDYFHRIPAYRSAVLAWLKDRGLRLRMAFINIDPAHATAYAVTMNKAKAGYRGKGRPKGKWRFVKRRR